MSAGGAKAYFEEGLSHGDYYFKGSERIGTWHGLGAEMLKLSGPVSRAEFHALCDNINPLTGDKLTPRTKTNRRVGYDFTFSVPKSVSLVHALGQDDRVIAAFQEAVRETMAEIETEMQTRMRKNGAYAHPITGNTIWSEFVHEHSRPVEGVPDPHLHCHAYVFNATYDKNEARWKAGEFGGLKRDAPYYEAAFDARLAHKLDALGYGIERRDKGWEIIGIERHLVDRFSRRTQEIEAAAKALGVETDGLKSTLGAKTRKGKSATLSASQVHQSWDDRLSREDRDRLKEAGRGTRKTEKMTTGEATEFAVANTYERQSVISKKRLMAEALKFGIGSVLPEAVHAAFAKRKDVITRDVRGEKLATTTHVLAEEKAMLRFAKEGRGTCKRFTVDDTVSEDSILSEEQRAALQTILGSTDRVMILRGGAGVGKTTLMKEVAQGIQRTGQAVHAFAPTADASRGVLRAEGFAEADTVAALLQNETLQNKVAGGVIWIDEAGLMGARAMNQVFALVQAKGARVLLSGDSRQHAAVARGDALRLLETEGGIVPATVHTIRRQTNERYRRAVAAIADGDISRGFEELDKMGAVQEVDTESRYRFLAEDYVAAINDNKSAIVVSPTHAEGAKVTDEIRTALRRDGALAVEQRGYAQLKRTNWSEAEKAVSRNYETGQMIEFHKPAKGDIKRAERLIVVARDDHRNVLAARADGSEVTLPLNQADRFTVFTPGNIDLSPGEQIRITKNAKPLDGKHRLNNGTTYEIAGYTKDGNIKLSNSWVLSKSFGHLDYGYCTTSHASQGKSVDRVLIAQSMESWPASNREQFYVSASRGKEAVKIYTDDKEQLREAVQRSGERLAATELVREGAGDRAAMLSRLAFQMRTSAVRARDYLLERYHHAADHFTQQEQGIER